MTDTVARGDRRDVRDPFLQFARDHAAGLPGGTRRSFTDDVNRRILWRRLDREGHEAARLESRGAGWQLSGAAVFAHEGQACALRYVILCDPSWRTVSANVAGWVGEEPVEVEILRAARGRWPLAVQRRRAAAARRVRRHRSELQPIHEPAADPPS